LKKKEKLPTVYCDRCGKELTAAELKLPHRALNYTFYFGERELKGELFFCPSCMETVITAAYNLYNEKVVSCLF
jgi:formylmethanofuran dehydrogenase subunit E